MKKIFMPLWFSDIIETEQKLASMEEKGFHLKDFSPAGGMFVFEEGACGKAVYRICRLKNCGGNPPSGILKNGWEKVCGSRNYYIIKTCEENNEHAPGYKSWLTANRIVLWASVLVMCMCIGMMMGMGMGALEDSNYDFFLHPVFIIPAIISCIALIPFVFAFKANRKLNKTTSDLKLGGGKLVKTIPEENFIYTPEEEKQMLKDGRMMKKTVPGWFYDPDKAAEMVEDMASKGWKFYRFDNMGVTFYYEKCEPCGLKFIVDYQNEATDDYFAQSKDDGWKLEFTSVARSMSFAVWTRTYASHEDKPEFYTDTESRVGHAKRMLLSFGLPFALVIIIGIAAMAALVPMLINDKDYYLLFPVFMYVIVIVEYIIFTSRVVRFYLRTVKQNKTK